MRPALNLERFAELSARLSAGQRRDEVLRSAAVEPEHWERSQAFWLGRMQDDAAKQRFALAQRYAALFKAAESRLSGSSKPRPDAKRKRSTQQVVAAIPAVPAPPATTPSPPPAPTARLTLEQFAAMRADMAVSPEDDIPKVRRRFGLDETTWEQEEAHWQPKLAGDHELFARYLKQFQYCRSLLQRG